MYKRLLIRSGILIALVLCFGAGYVWLARSYYAAPFDRAYMNDLYDHSQYMIAESYRSVNDEQVYQVIGDRLIAEQTDPFTIDPQVPPLGKMLYGITIQLTGNAYWLNVPMFLLVGLGTYLLAWMITRKTRVAWFATLVLLTEPLLAVQMKKTMLDLVQTMFLTWCSVALLVGVELHSRGKISLARMSILLSGLLLGFFSVTKFGLLTMPLFFFVCWYLVSQIRGKKVIGYLLMFILGAGVGYVIPYIPHILHVGVIQFLKNQKWLVAFWLKGGATTKAFIGMPIITLATGWYRHFMPGSAGGLTLEWSPTWLVSIYVAYAFIRKAIDSRTLRHLDPKRYVYGIAIVVMIVYSLIPFYVRYITIILPVMSLMVVEYLIAQKKLHLIVVICILSLIRTPFLFQDMPHDMVAGLEQAIKRGLYKEVYEIVDPQTRARETRDQFWVRNYTAWHTMQAKNITFAVQVPWMAAFRSDLELPYTLAYETPIGFITRQGVLQSHLHVGRRSIVWQDDLVVPFMQPGSKVTLSLVDGAPGAIVNPQGDVVYEEKQMPFLTIMRDQVKDEARVTDYVSKLMEKSTFDIENIYKTNHIGSLPARVGFVPVSRLRLIGQPPAGVLITPRQMVPTGLPGNFPGTFSQVGGRLIITDNMGISRLLLKRTPVDGAVTYWDPTL